MHRLPRQTVKCLPLLSLEEVERSLARAMKKVLGSMVSNRYTGNPDYITSQEIKAIAADLFERL